MKKVSATVISNEQLWGEYGVGGTRKYLGTWLMRLKCPNIASEARPGQFVMVYCGEECLLPRPFSIHQVDEDGITLFYAVLVGGKGTNWLSQRYMGGTVKLFGPLGNGFSIQPRSNNLLLVAGGNGIAPLQFLAQKALKKKLSVTMLYGTVDSKRYPVSSQLELVSATEDGTVGYQGMITDLLPDSADRADQIFACGPVGMYQAMARMPELKNKSVQVSLEVMMGCGRGVCYGCTVKTKQGLKLCCQDGPVFELDNIIWDDIV
ncbi:MAG: dihydroorotate dehydrogenase electron transfer subunit [Dehalococcoidales bacterium]|nr:MAG: dihydroorotate dehydrogenase electron transfer subunit [Dehalococcoidales bacterium]